MSLLRHHYPYLLVMLLLLLLLQFGATVAADPAHVPGDWAEGVANHDILFSGAETAAQHLPVIGNGMLSWQIDSPYVYLNGLFTRQRDDKAVVRRAKLPSQLSVLPQAVTPTDAAVGQKKVAENASLISSTTSSFMGDALDFRNGRFVRRRRFTLEDIADAQAAMVVVEVEQRWYAHRSFHSLLVMEIKVTTTTPDALSVRPLELQLIDTSALRERKQRGRRGRSREEMWGEGEEEREDEEKEGTSNNITITVLTATGSINERDQKVAHCAGSTSSSDCSSSSTMSSSKDTDDEDQDIFFEDLSSQHPGLQVYRGTVQAPENTSSTILVSLVSDPLPSSILVTKNQTWHFLSAMRSSLGEGGSEEGTMDDGKEMKADDLVQRTVLDYRLAKGMAPSQELFELHKDGWKQWWNDVGVEVEMDEKREKGRDERSEGGGGGWLPAAVNASFYILGSMARDDWATGVGRGGGAVVLGEEGREGGVELQHVMWDMEMYVFPALLMFNPSWSRALIRYRFLRLAAAVGAAAGAETGEGKKGREGREDWRRTKTLFPWESAGTGEEVSRKEKERGQGSRVHVSGAVAWAAWQFWMATQDEGWMEEVGFPLLRSVANMWVARAEEGSGGGGTGSATAHLCGVIPPDESAGVVDDSTYVNGLAKMSLGWAMKAAMVVKQQQGKRKQGMEEGSQEEEEAWEHLCARLDLPYDKDRGIHPEYDGYVDAPISQADVVLVGYPLGYFHPPSLPPSSPPALANLNISETDKSRSRNVRVADLAFYRARFKEGQEGRNGGREGGLTWGMHAVNELDVGEGVEAQAAFLRAYEPYCQRPFGVWTEGERKSGSEGGGEGTDTNKSSKSVFLPAAGSFLQALVQGYGGLRLLEAEGGREGGSMLRVSPACPVGVRRVKYRHLVFLGNHFSGFTYTCRECSRKRRKISGGEEKEGGKEGKWAEEDEMTFTLTRTEPGAPALALLLQRNEDETEGGHIHDLIPMLAGQCLTVPRKEAFLVALDAKDVER